MIWFLPLIPIPIILFFLCKYHSPEISPNANIVILGSKGAGKTTLWEKLKGIQGIKYDEYQPSATLKEPIEEFEVQSEGRSIIVASTYDIGGGDDFVKCYEDLIKDNTYIFYLFDVSELSDKNKLKEITARLLKLEMIMKTHENNAMQLLATHSDEYQPHDNLTVEDYVQKKLSVSKYKYKHAEDVVLPINLLDDKQIDEKIRKRIIDSTEKGD